MARLLIVAFALVSCVFADDPGYSAPSTGYGAPNTYAAPADNYGVPTYGEPTGYGAPVVEDDGGFSLDKLKELLPFFLAVFAALIVAQLLAPLVALLFNAKLGLFGGLFGGLAGGKIDLLNAILGPFNLAICTIDPLEIAGNGREFASGFNMNPELVDLLTGKLYDAIQTYSN